MYKKFGLIGLAIFSSTVFAASNQVAPLGKNTIKPYIGLEVGQGSLTTSGSNVPPEGKENGATLGLAYQLFGGVQFNKYVAVEAFYTDFGTLKKIYTDDDEDIKTNTPFKAMGLNVKGILPLKQSRVSLFAKIGYAINIQAKTRCSGPTDSSCSLLEHVGTYTFSGFSYGVGAAYKVSSKFDAFVQYSDTIGTGTSKTPVGNIGITHNLGMIGIGLTYSI